MAKNSRLTQAKTNKKDEFYTQLKDIENELYHYRDFFCGKVVFCNCDDPYESNFFKYFANNFNFLGLKKLICTCYAKSHVAWRQLELIDAPELSLSLSLSEENPAENSSKKPYKIEITEVPDSNGDGTIDLADVEYLVKNGKNVLSILKGDGDFRSQECIELLKEADVVVTNPPFSLFREYVAQLVQYDKKFIIIGNISAFTYKEIFPLLKDNKMWIGPSIHSGDRAFYVPDDYKLEAAGCGIDEKTNRKYIQVKGVRWFTNVDVKQRHEKLLLYKNFTPEEYPKYDNFDAINVDNVSEIPCDYDGIMGVPITFLDKYNPDQFEIIGCSASKQLFGIEGHKPSESFLALVLSGKVRTGGTPSMAKPCFIDSEGFANVGYHRIFIKSRSIA